MSKKYLYYFSEGNDAFGGDKVTMKNILGGKGAGLAEMTAVSKTEQTREQSPRKNRVKGLMDGKLYPSP